jgi:hypothetical protein
MKEKLKDMRQLVEFSPAFDKRDPNPKKDYGIGAINIRFVLVGKKGAVHALLGTNLYLPEVVKEKPSVIECSQLNGWDEGYHSPKPKCEGQTRSSKRCHYIGKPCYYDGSGLAADKYVGILLHEGSDGVWKELHKYYLQVFGK